MESRDRFELQGVTYYQQRRKCGKAACRTCQDGRGHGPYWYGRDQVTGKVRYIGRDLPAELAETRATHDRMLGDMVAQRRALIERADALTRLIGNRPLQPGDREMLAGLGFGACLVPDSDRARTQEPNTREEHNP